MLTLPEWFLVLSYLDIVSSTVGRCMLLVGDINTKSIRADKLIETEY